MSDKKFPNAKEKGNAMQNFRKILVTKQGGIGDVLLATPILAELKRAYPEARLTFLVRADAVPIVEGLPFIDQVFPYDKETQGFYPLYQILRGQDAAIFLDLTYRPAMAAALARVPVRIGIRHKRKFWLTSDIPWKPYMDHTYEPYVFANILRDGLGLGLSHERLNQPYLAPPTEEERQELHSVLAAHGLSLATMGFAQGTPYLACAPKTAFFLKDWPLHRWNTLFQRIYQAYGIKSVVFGKTFVSYPWDAQSVINLSGKLSLRQAGELILQAALLVNSDSMPIHMAAAEETPAVILSGPTDPKRWAPRRHAAVVQAKLACVPCDGYHARKCFAPICMETIAIDQVFLACQTMIEQNPLLPRKA